METDTEFDAFRKKVTTLVSDDLEFRLCANLIAQQYGLTLSQALREHPQEYVDLLDSWFDPGIDETLHFSLDPSILVPAEDGEAAP